MGFKRSPVRIRPPRPAVILWRIWQYAHFTITPLSLNLLTLLTDPVSSTGATRGGTNHVRRSGAMRKRCSTYEQDSVAFACRPRQRRNPPLADGFGSRHSTGRSEGHSAQAKSGVG